MRKLPFAQIHTNVLVLDCVVPGGRLSRAALTDAGFTHKAFECRPAAQDYSASGAQHDGNRTSAAAEMSGVVAPLSVCLCVWYLWKERSLCSTG